MATSAVTPEQLKIESNLDTKLTVVEALGTLMEQTSIDRISVSLVCEAANISRATFYRCFRDKFDVVEWHLRFINAKGVDRIGQTLSWYEGYFISEALIMDNIGFFTNAAKSQDRNSLDHIAPRVRRDRLIRTLVDVRDVELTERLRVQVNSAVLTETYLFPAWHYGKYDATLEEVCTWMCECVPRELFELLNTPLKPAGGLGLKSASAKGAKPDGSFRAPHPPRQS